MSPIKQFLRCLECHRCVLIGHASAAASFLHVAILSITAEALGWGPGVSIVLPKGDRCGTQSSSMINFPNMHFASLLSKCDSGPLGDRKTYESDNGEH